MAFKVTPRKPQISYIIGSIVVLGLWFMLGSTMLISVNDAMACKESLFSAGSELIGMDTTTVNTTMQPTGFVTTGGITPPDCNSTGVDQGDTVYMGQPGSSGLLDVLGLITAAAIFIMAFVKINF